MILSAWPIIPIILSVRFCYTLYISKVHHDHHACPLLHSYEHIEVWPYKLSARCVDGRGLVALKVS